MGGGNGYGVYAAIGQCVDMVDDSFMVEFALLIPSGGNSRAAE